MVCWQPDVIDVERHVALFDVDMIDGVPDILTVDANHRRMVSTAWHGQLVIIIIIINMYCMHNVSLKSGMANL